MFENVGEKVKLYVVIGSMNIFSFFLKTVFFWFCLSGPFSAFNQNKVIDSLLNSLKHPKNDTFRIDILYNLAQEQYGYDSIKGMKYLNEGYVLAKKMNFLFQQANYYQIKSKLLNPQPVAFPLLDTAMSLYEKSVAQKQTPNLDKQARISIATCKSSQASILSRQGKYKEAIASYLDAMDVWEKSDDPQRNESTATYYNNIAGVYFELKQPEKALEYDKRAIAYRILDKNDERLALSYNFVSDDYMLLSNFDSALAYVQKVRPLIDKIKKPSFSYNYYHRVASIYRGKKDFRQAVAYGEKALSEATASGNPFSIANASRSLAMNYISTNDIARARNYLLKALDIQEENNYVVEKLKTLNELVAIEEKTNHPGQAYIYLKQVKEIEDSIKTNESKKAVAEIENKYQAAEKQKSILRLQKEKQEQAFSLKQKSALNYALIASLAIFVMIGFLVYRNFRNGQLLAKQNEKLHEQKIRELEKDRQLVAVDAMLKGQEEERNRLAKDLHDGLGGMLSGVKFSLMNMKGNLFIDHENVKIFERSLDMLNSSIQELRRVAHNMMPEALVKFGLDEALKDYFNDINNANILQVKYQSFGMEKRPEGTTEIIIYRIIQELFNNIFKHANATEVLVQLLREGRRLTVTVEDNGKGFNIKELENNRGAGWANIRNRVDYLRGKLDLHAEPGNGTSVNIELNIAEK